MAFAKGIKPFNKEIKFQVGERVRIDCPDIKPEEINCDTGIIVGIEVRFVHTPEMRMIRYKLRMDGEYLKKYVYCKIGELWTVDIKWLRKV